MFYFDLPAGLPGRPCKENAMQHSHLSALENKHARLELQIASEANRPSPDNVKLHALKNRSSP